MLWNDSYKTGVDVIDLQNFEIVASIREMMQFEDNKKRLTQLEVFEELVKKYFEREEKLHDECGFDAYLHRISHEIYINALQQIKRNFEKTGTTMENEKFFRTNVVEFFKKHIKSHDMCFAYFYRNNILYKNVNVKNQLIAKAC